MCYPTHRYLESPGLVYLGRNRQMAVIRLVHIPDRQGATSWIETRTSPQAYRTLVVLRVARIYAVATKYTNEEWNQQMTRREKLQTEQITAEQRPAFLQHQMTVRQTQTPLQVSRGSLDNVLGSMCTQTERATTREMSKTLKARRNFAAISAEISTQRNSPPPRNRA